MSTQWLTVPDTSYRSPARRAQSSTRRVQSLARRKWSSAWLQSFSHILQFIQFFLFSPEIRGLIPSKHYCFAIVQLFWRGSMGFPRGQGLQASHFCAKAQDVPRGAASSSPCIAATIITTTSWCGCSPGYSWFYWKVFTTSQRPTTISCNIIYSSSSHCHLSISWHQFCCSWSVVFVVNWQNLSCLPGHLPGTKQA